MKRSYRLYCVLCAAGTLLLCTYPLVMGVRVLSDMLCDGTVMSENYPKYIIPYTPISLAVILGAALMPLLFRLTEKWAQGIASVLCLGLFFLSELLLESKVIVTSTVKTTLESWQMYMCYVPPDSYETRTWRAIDVLIGEYSPAFKLHFYAISIVLILGALNCIYGFGQMVRSGKRDRISALVIQSVSLGLFLGLCILACFTAFFRDGEITVSPLSAVLMILFFVILGVTVGLFTGSFLLKKSVPVTAGVSAASACAATLLMYIGEMLLLDGNLYQFGRGFFFEALGELVVAPVDILTILLSGAVTGLIMYLIQQKSPYSQRSKIH